MSSVTAPAAAADTASVPCVTCRKRRVKCDKRLPGCSRCEASQQTCPGYNRVRTFVDQGAFLREKYPEQSPPATHSYHNQPHQGHRDTLPHIRASTGYAPSSSSSNTGADDAATVAHDTSSEVHTVSTTPAFVDTSHTDGTSQIADDGSVGFVGDLDSLSGSDFDAVFFDIDPGEYYRQPNNCCGWIPNAHLINDSHDSLAPTTLSWYTPIGSESIPDSPRHPAPESRRDSDAQSRDSQSDDVDSETAHLIQHFSQHISPCLDIFDIQRYFGHAVPVRALESTLLRNLVAALSAKQFANTRKENSSAPMSPTIAGRGWPATPSCLDQYYCHIPNREWFYRAASFYDKAITQMMELLQSLRNGTLLAESPSSRVTPGSRSLRVETLIDSGASSPRKRQRTDSRNSQYKKALDDLLAAVTIFLLYESLDNRKIEILSHMSGAQYLLKEHLPGTTSSNGGPTRSLETAQAWRASFWNIAIVDYSQAYTERTTPRLNTQDQYLWKAAGLPLRNVDGVLVPESLCGARDGFDEDPAPMTETVACRTLVWIILRALTYVAVEDNNGSVSERDRGVTPQDLPAMDPEAWHIIRQHLRDWEDLLPYTFKPFAALPRPGGENRALTVSAISTINDAGEDAVKVSFPTLCYSSFMASTATVLYHFIQICLLLHKPLPSSPSESISRFASRRLAAYRQVSQEIDEHAEKICSICLGLQPGNDASQMHMKQPLHLAGLCFEDKGQRFVLEGLLKGVQRVSGWSTEWIVSSLRGEWGWDAVVP